MDRNRTGKVLKMCIRDRFKPDRRFEITVRSMPSYNNSFEALLKDLKRYKKNGSRVLLL